MTFQVGEVSRLVVDVQVPVIGGWWKVEGGWGEEQRHVCAIGVYVCRSSVELERDLEMLHQLLTMDVPSSKCLLLDDERRESQMSVPTRQRCFLSHRFPALNGDGARTDTRGGMRVDYEYRLPPHGSEPQILIRRLIWAGTNTSERDGVTLQL